MAVAAGITSVLVQTVESFETSNAAQAAPGVLRSYKGTVYFSTDYVTVKLDLRPVYKFFDSLKEAKIALNQLLTHPENKVINNSTLSMLNNEWRRLGMMIPSRAKRSLFSFGGDILHSIFGTATDKQIDKVHERVNVLEAWAKAKGTLIKQTVERLNTHSEKIAQLNTDLQSMSEILNSNSVTVHKLKLNGIAIGIASYLGFLIEQFDTISNALALAGKDIVSPNLFSPSELQDVLFNAKDKHGSIPIYSMDRIHDYYNILHVKIVHDYLYIFVPFSSAVNFGLYHFVPFPTFINDDMVVELDIQETYVLIDSEFNSVAITQGYYYEKYCVAVASQKYMCPSNKFHFFPSSKFSCFLNLAVHFQTTPTCKFRNVNTNVTAYHASPYTYIFSRNPIKLTISCGGSPKLKTVKGNIELNENCGVSAPNNLKIFPSTNRAADAPTFVPRYTGLFLRNISFPQPVQKLIIKKMSKETNLTDDTVNWADFFDHYHPHATYIGTPLLLIVIVIAIVVVGRFVYKRKLASVVRNVATLVRDQEARSAEQGGENLEMREVS